MPDLTNLTTWKGYTGITCTNPMKMQKQPRKSEARRDCIGLSATQTSASGFNTIPKGEKNSEGSKVNIITIWYQLFFKKLNKEAKFPSLFWYHYFSLASLTNRALFYNSRTEQPCKKQKEKTKQIISGLGLKHGTTSVSCSPGRLNVETVAVMCVGPSYYIYDICIRLFLLALLV